MKEFTQNINNTYGAKGQTWLTELPVIVEQLAAYWQLKNILPVKNMSFNFIAKALSASQPIVLKIGFDNNAIAQEKEALTYFNGNASILLIDHSDKYNALLLQQAVPGITLTSLYPEKLEFVMDCYVDTMHKLHAKHLSNPHHYRHIKDWLKSIDNVSSETLPSLLLKKAIQLKNSLLESSKTLVYLHGDLHHDNILQHENTWLTIDPKGIVGELEFEIAAFDFMYVAELANNVNAKEIIESRIELLALKANINAARIKNWVFVRLILMAAWSIEDNSDPSLAIKLAEVTNDLTTTGTI